MANLNPTTEIIQRARQAAFQYVKEHQHLEPELGDAGRVWLAVDLSTRSSKAAKVLANNGFREQADGRWTMLNPSGLWYGSSDLRARAAEAAAEILRRDMRVEVEVVREGGGGHIV